MAKPWSRTLQIPHTSSRFLRLLPQRITLNNQFSYSIDVRDVNVNMRSIHIEFYRTFCKQKKMNESWNADYGQYDFECNHSKQVSTITRKQKHTISKTSLSFHFIYYLF